MKRIDTGSAVDIGGGDLGFTNGNPSTGTPATDLDASWCNSLQEEICTVIEDAEIELDAGSFSQLKTAIAAMIAAAVPDVPEYEQYAIGEPFAVWDHITGAAVPDNSGTQKYIKLTAGLTGSGAFNEGLLTSESVSGSSPNITATAVIVGGPMNGQTVDLINTERRFRRAGSSGTKQDDQVESHNHSYTVDNNSGSSFSSIVQVGDGGSTLGSGSTSSYGGDETRPRNIGETIYMRII